MSGTAPRSIFFGWKVVLTAFTVATFTFGFGYYGPAVFLNVLHQQRGWPVSIIATAITVHYLVSAVLVARLPEAHRRFGIAAVTQAGAVALVVGMCGWSLAASPWFLFVAAILSGAGWAATSGAAIIAMVSPWFERRRALALGHALNGASVGGVLFAPLWVALIAAIGFAPAVAVVGLVTLALLLPLTWRYLRPTPRSLGVAADGDPPQSTWRAVVPAQYRPVRFVALLSNGQFTTLAIAFALGMFAQVGVVAHLITRLAPLVGAVDAAIAISLATGSAVVGRLLLGLFPSQADRRLIAAANFAMQACGVALLAFGSTPLVLAPGCILFGLGIGSMLSLPPLIAQTEFAAGDVPRVVALVTAVNQAVFAFAPAVFGVLREASGAYTMPFLLAAVGQVIAGTVIVLGRPGHRPARARFGHASLNNQRKF
jgi:predicted MFS family arabinose efflux permease